MNPVKFLYERKSLSLALILSWMTLIFFMSSIPNEDMPKTAGSYTSLLHIPEYMVLGFLCAPLMGDRKYNTVLTLSFCLFYGATDELHQTFVAGRTASFLDWAYDGLGGLLGALFSTRWGGSNAA